MTGQNERYRFTWGEQGEQSLIVSYDTLVRAWNHVKEEGEYLTLYDPGTRRKVLRELTRSKGITGDFDNLQVVRI